MLIWTLQIIKTWDLFLLFFIFPKFRVNFFSRCRLISFYCLAHVARRKKSLGEIKFLFPLKVVNFFRGEKIIFVCKKSISLWNFSIKSKKKWLFLIRNIYCWHVFVLFALSILQCKHEVCFQWNKIWLNSNVKKTKNQNKFHLIWRKFWWNFWKIWQDIFLRNKNSACHVMTFQHF